MSAGRVTRGRNFKHTRESARKSLGREERNILEGGIGSRQKKGNFFTRDLVTECLLVFRIYAMAGRREGENWGEGFPRVNTEHCRR